MGGSSSEGPGDQAKTVVPIPVGRGGNERHSSPDRVMRPIAVVVVAADLVVAMGVVSRQSAAGCDDDRMMKYEAAFLYLDGGQSVNLNTKRGGKCI